MASNYYTVVGNVTKTASGKPGFQISEMMLIDDKAWEKMRYDKKQMILFLQQKYPDIVDIDDGFSMKPSISSDFKAFGVKNPNAKENEGEKKEGCLTRIIKDFFAGIFKKVITAVIGILILYGLYLLFEYVI